MSAQPLFAERHQQNDLVAARRAARGVTSGTALWQAMDGRTVLFVDTEFSYLPLTGESFEDWSAHARLVSVGATVLQSDQRFGAEFYAAAELTLPLLRACSDFVRSNVIPQLDAHPIDVRFNGSDLLAERLRAFVDAHRGVDGKPPLIAVDWAGDAWLLAPLLDSDVEFVVLDDVPDIRLFQRGIYCPRPRHNALDDARTTRDGFLSFVQREVGGWDDLRAVGGAAIA